MVVPAADATDAHCDTRHGPRLTKIVGRASKPNGRTVLTTRAPAGIAEVSLVFDNNRGLLRPSLQDLQGTNGVVSVTRRLYRDGQSEYLINKTPCRLRDIREMFMDTGIGRDAYSLIEQGRVELFLQASHEDRRAIFDEAAGISKYKARKRETIRRLERVEQNLLRLNDILGEVEKRLRSIKYQAGKARNYQAYTERLKELRSLHFLAKYHTLSQDRRQMQANLDAAGDSLAAINARIDRLETARSGTEVEAVDLERTSRDLQGRIASVSAQITTCQERADMLSARVKELGQQIAVAAGRCEALEAKFERLDREIAARQSEFEQIGARCCDLAGSCEAFRTEQSAAEQAITHLQARLEDEKAGTIDLLRRTAQLHNEIHGLGIRREGLHGQKARLAGRAEQVAQSLREALTERAKVESKLGDVNEVLSAAQRRLEDAKQTDRRLAVEEHESQSKLVEAREQRSAVVSRIDALREMQQRLEGIGEGVRRVLGARRDGRLQALRGMLGEFLETDMDHALVVEAAVGTAEQLLVATGLDDVMRTADELADILGDSGTVEILCLDRLGPLQEDLDLAGCPQAVARVIDWVRFEPWLAPAMWRLLGRTLVVRSLAEAVAAARSAPSGCRFVTLRGEVVEADGRVRLGLPNHATGIITRRSELAELQATKIQVDQCIAEHQHSCQEIRNQREHLEELQQSFRTAIYEANAERVENESRLAQCNERIAQLQQEEPLIAGDMENLAAEIEASVRAEHEAKEKVAELECLNLERQQEIDRLNTQIAGARGRQEELAAQMTEKKVALAQAEEKRLAIREALADMTQQRDQMQEDLGKQREEISLNRQRRTDAEAAIVKANEEVDRLYGEQKQLDREAEEAEETRRGLQERLEQIRNQLLEQRKAQEQASGEVNTVRVQLGETDVRIEGLIARASDEMGMNLLELHASYEHDEDRDWDAVEAEIQELRDKIERLGNVNLDAIAEQEQLQQRREFLSTQLADIKASQDQLHELIRRINRESRQMFLETFGKVRENFHQLFRKLFGGGRADIFLVDEEDVLESGIEIVAQPPGKELRSLSLLSGGEKTMTALALLFSIFKSRPSPFCLLDEVDAALDEANNERFNHLVREFVPVSQIIIISHAKRTMSMANVLYGVTMQEPGVSKRISVRFEDVGKKLDEQLAPVGA